MAVSILSNPIVKDILLPFVLVFALVFAVLEKTEILGKEKRQTNAIISLAIALIVIAVGSVTDLITNLIPILAVGLVILLVFMLLWGMVFKAGTFEMPHGVRIAVGIIAAAVVVISVIYFTNSWNYIKSLFEGSNVMSNIIFIVLIAIAVIVVIYPWKSEKAGG